MFLFLKAVSRSCCSRIDGFRRSLIDFFFIIQYIVYMYFQSVWCIHKNVSGAVCHRNWDSREKAQSSTWKELTAISFSIIRFLPILRGKHVV